MAELIGKGVAIVAEKLTQPKQILIGLGYLD
jgi:hypothetical protein